MNWGKGIIAGMILFMLFILTMCVYMFMAPVDDYDHEYYEKGLTFNQYYNKEKQVIKDNARPVVSVSGGNIRVVFTRPAKGSLKLQRPSDNQLDKVYQLSTGAANEFEVPVEGITKGQWILIFNWTSNNKEYLYQQEMFIK
ncbi:FixH family protein [Mucilaginibacter xinganensis]|uniref:FixH protein n=1 Tax=Mucilaginibacter xinganensis TaxID=1234841 RepID=A0A223NQ78_9SPHI|nr:FixH family protein [Mucilaginibacter xinganensis]ASU31956.1 FixH protein [Mucilaginibacter xinganensis]